MSGPTLGTLSGDGQSLTYQRTVAGDDSLTFVTHRGGATSLPATITIHNDPPFAISVAPEIAGLGLTLQGYSAGALVDVPLVSLGGEGSGNVRFAVELTGLDPGAPLKLVGELDRLKLREKTIVLFTGDNGTAHFGPAIVDARRISGKKASMLEGGSRVPLIVNCPGTTRAAAVNHDLIDFSDFFSTFAQLGGATLPAGVTLDSRSFAQQIKGEKGTPREWVYVELGGNSHARDARYKLTNKGGLFDLKNAPWDEAPVAADTKDEGAIASRARLQAALSEHPAKAGGPDDGQKGGKRGGKKNGGKKRRENATTPPTTSVAVQ